MRHERSYLYKTPSTLFLLPLMCAGVSRPERLDQDNCSYKLEQSCS